MVSNKCRLLTAHRMSLWQINIIIIAVVVVIVISTSVPSSRVRNIRSPLGLIVSVALHCAAVTRSAAQRRIRREQPLRTTLK